MIEALKARIVDDWREALKWSSVRVNITVAALSALMQTMPALDPSIAGMLPQWMQSPAIGIYALLGLGLRLTKLKANG